MTYGISPDIITGKGIVTVFHGNKDASMTPEYRGGTYDRDFGAGFYVTLNSEMAKAWSYAANSPAKFGYLHSYQLHTINLRVLDFNRVDSLYWLAEVIRNRYCDFKSNIPYHDLSLVSELLEQYRINNLDSYDVIMGYSMDNGLFFYACALLQGNISKEMFEAIMKQYSYCMQLCLKSKHAFKALTDHAVKRVPVAYRGQFQCRELETRQSVANIHGFSKNTAVRDYLISRQGIVAYNVGAGEFRPSGIVDAVAR